MKPEDHKKPIRKLKGEAWPGKEDGLNDDNSVTEDDGYLPISKLGKGKLPQ